MAWTQATDPTNTNPWMGDCSGLDIFTVTVPTQPGDVDFPGLTSAYDSNNIHFMDGFEYPVAYYTTTGTLWDLTVGNPSTQGSISTSVRDTALTGGHALQIISTSSAGAQYNNLVKPLSPTYQYVRVYVKVVSATNANGSQRSYSICGWYDSTGFRSSVNITFPAAAGTTALKFGVEHAVFGDSSTGTVSLTVGTWYRVELVTERLTAGYTSTANIYVGDTDTIFDTITAHSSSVAMGGFPFVACPAGNSGNALTLLFDDLRVQTSTRTIAASVDNTQFGPGGIWALYPSEVNTSEWTPLSGTNWSNVDEFPVGSFDSDTTYISDSNTTSKTDLYGVSVHPNTLPDRMFIKAVMVRALYKNTAGTPSVRTAYQDGLETTYLGSQDVAGGSYEATSYSFLMYDDGLPTELVALEGIGINHVATAANTIRCTSVWGLIDVAQEA